MLRDVCGPAKDPVNQGTTPEGSKKQRHVKGGQSQVKRNAKCRNKADKKKINNQSEDKKDERQRIIFANPVQFWVSYN